MPSIALPSNTLIAARDLLALCTAGSAPVIVETSFDLADTGAGERAWREGHLPGSVYLHLDRDLSGAKTGRNGRHPLPERAAFGDLLGRIGIAHDTPVVLLDRQGGPYAARAWWMLRWMGHTNAAVLDGGVAAWQAAGGALTTEAPATVPTTPHPHPHPHPHPQAAASMPHIGADALLQRLGQLRVIDARPGERFRGEIEPIDSVAGHIPGARHRFFKDNLGPDGRFKPAAQLRDEFTPLLAGQAAESVVHQCGSGVTACHNLLAMEHAGLTGSQLYPGSWSEWSCDPARPVARG